MIKTNAMRFLDTQRCAYEVLVYDNPNGLLDVSEVAEKIGKLPETVFKTLVTVGHSKKCYVFVVPAGYDLDLKKGARVCGEKNLEMLPMKQLLPVTGYMHGGCSPIGLKKPFPVYFPTCQQSLVFRRVREKGTNLIQKNKINGLPAFRAVFICGNETVTAFTAPVFLISKKHSTFRPMQ